MNRVPTNRILGFAEMCYYARKQGANALELEINTDRNGQSTCLAALVVAFDENGRSLYDDNNEDPYWQMADGTKRGQLQYYKGPGTMPDGLVNEYWALEHSGGLVAGGISEWCVGTIPYPRYDLGAPLDNVDWELLADQKDVLIDVMDEQTNNERAQALIGIIGHLDAIQDYAEKNGVPEYIAFNLTNEE